MTNKVCIHGVRWPHQCEDCDQQFLAQAMTTNPTDEARKMNSLHIVFDKFPGPDGARFIEVETSDGKSINAGEWRTRPDGLVELVITASPYDAGLVDEALSAVLTDTRGRQVGAGDGDTYIVQPISGTTYKKVCTALTALRASAPQVEAGEEYRKAIATGPNPYYTPTIIAAFREHKEREYGARLADEQFRLGNGAHQDEPYYTAMALEFRLFKAGAEWLERFKDQHAEPPATQPPAVGQGVEEAACKPLETLYVTDLGREGWYVIQDVDGETFHEVEGPFETRLKAEYRAKEISLASLSDQQGEG